MKDLRNKGKDVKIHPQNYTNYCCKYLKEWDTLEKQKKRIQEAQRYVHAIMLQHYMHYVKADKKLSHQRFQLALRDAHRDLLKSSGKSPDDMSD